MFGYQDVLVGFPVAFYCVSCVQVEHRRKEQVLGRKSEQQDVFQRVTAKPEEELAEENKELQEWRNSQLRESIGRILQENRQSRYH